MPQTEMDLYAHVIGPAAVKRSTNGKLDIKLFWKSNASELPNLYKVASIYCTATLGSYDVEALFFDSQQRSHREANVNDAKYPQGIPFPELESAS